MGRRLGNVENLMFATRYVRNDYGILNMCIIMAQMCNRFQ